MSSYWESMLQLLTAWANSKFVTMSFWRAWVCSYAVQVWNYPSPLYFAWPPSFFLLHHILSLGGILEIKTLDPRTRVCLQEPGCDLCAQGHSFSVFWSVWFTQNSCIHFSILMWNTQIHRTFSTIQFCEHCRQGRQTLSRMNLWIKYLWAADSQTQAQSADRMMEPQEVWKLLWLHLPLPTAEPNSVTPLTQTPKGIKSVPSSYKTVKGCLSPPPPSYWNFRIPFV